MDNPQDAISELLSDPAALSRAMEMAKSLLGNIPAQSTVETAAPKESVQSAVPAVREDDKTRLLLALKPYLSPKRSEKVGTILALMKGLEVLGTTSLFDWGK